MNLGLFEWLNGKLLYFFLIVFSSVLVYFDNGLCNIGFVFFYVCLLLIFFGLFNL